MPATPDAKWVPIDQVKGENGNPQDDPATSAAWAYFGITNTATDPERLYAMYDDMCGLDNYIERRYGVEGRGIIPSTKTAFTIRLSRQNPMKTIPRTSV